MRTSRVEAFSDGVFAVAITLLVLQFIPPEVQSGKLLSALLRQWPQLVTYTASFLTVGVVWVNHHTIFRGLKEVDRFKPLRAVPHRLALRARLLVVPVEVVSYAGLAQSRTTFYGPAGAMKRSASS